MFMNCQSLTTLNLSKNIRSIHDGIFIGCTQPIRINYNGTRNEWVTIKREETDIPSGSKLVCTDGEYTLDRTLTPS